MIVSQESLFDFQNIAPIPTFLNALGQNRASVNLWGTKWNACEVKIEQNSPENLIIQFTTANTPPIPIIRRLSVLFPALSFTLDYHEPEHQIAGTYRRKPKKQEESSDETP